MELNELKRDIKVIGKAKEIVNVRQGEAKSSGRKYLAYTLVVMVENEKNGTVDDIKVDFFAMDETSPYKSQSKFLEQGKTVAIDGYDSADLVNIVGQLELEEYVNKKGNHVQFNKLQGAFIHRLEEDMRHRAVANAETVITEISDKLNDDDLPTGEKIINGFTIGYREEVVIIKDAIVPTSLAEDFAKIYKPGQTAMLTYQFINRAVGTKPDQQEQEEEAPTAAFGAVADIKAGKPKFTDYDTRTLVIGGLPAYDEDLALTKDEIEHALEVRKQKEAEVVNSQHASPAPAKTEKPKQSDNPWGDNNGFGSSDDDVPDF